jgi:uncharacterized protein with HEPN domain
MTQHNDAIRMRHMLDHARKAVAMARGQTREDLDRDEKLNLALTRLVEIIGEAAARVSKGSRERHEGIPWVHIIALRNRLIHGYDAVDLDILWDIIQLDLPALIQSLETALGKSSIRSIQLKSKIKPIKPTIPRTIPSHPATSATRSSIACNTSPGSNSSPATR